ncbi:hypothetical protein H2198_004956 [Neophaeococcomyces mojaviensis]|uniref:Uncharacterized protein n=1 Tax=Neophaeococcomyces mojaviensis TaxID=3383035 RepID=A0ACC3A783_9EURO|nr:hypothetical protein H2198_004956 [Knufia sp. JES_112]
MSHTGLLDLLCLVISCRLFCPTSNYLVRSDQECLWILRTVAFLARIWDNRHRLGQFFQTSFDQLFGSEAIFDLSVIPPFRVQPADQQKKCMFIKADGKPCQKSISLKDRETAMTLRQAISVRLPTLDCIDLTLMLHDLARLCKCNGRHRNLSGFENQNANTEQNEQELRSPTISSATLALIAKWIKHIVKIYEGIERNVRVEQALEAGALPSVGAFSHADQLSIESIQKKAMVMYTNTFSVWFPMGVVDGNHGLESSNNETPQTERMAARDITSMQPDICKPLTSLERAIGFVYIFRRSDQGQTMNMSVKIGFSKEVKMRMENIHSKCGFKPRVEYKGKVINAKRVEALVHAELHIRGHRYNVHICDSCNSEHREWFDVSIEEAKGVVEYWLSWMEKHNPYDIHGKFTPEATRNVYAAASRCLQQRSDQSSQISDPLMQENEDVLFEQDSTGQIWFNAYAPFSTVTKETSHDKQADSAIASAALMHLKDLDLQSTHADGLSLSASQSKSRKRVGVELPPALATDSRCSRPVASNPLRNAFIGNGPSFHRQVTLHPPAQPTPSFHLPLGEPSTSGRNSMPATPTPAPRSSWNYSTTTQRGGIPTDDDDDDDDDDDKSHVEQVSDDWMVTVALPEHVPFRLSPHANKTTHKSDKCGQPVLTGKRSRPPSPFGVDSEDFGASEELVVRTGRARDDGRRPRISSTGKLDLPHIVGHRRVRSVGSVA